MSRATPASEAGPIDEAAIERGGLDAVRELLDRASGVATTADLPALFGWLARRGVRAGLALRIMPDAFASPVRNS